MSCPFSCSAESEEAQNFGCLPSAHDIVQLKEETGHNWECHGAEGVLCGGFARFLRDHRPDLHVKTGGLLSFYVWETEGFEAALTKANKKPAM